jgi:hypothetical protein
MGWATGSGVAEQLWVKIRPYIKEEDYKDIANIIVSTFEEYDADDWIVEPSEDCLYYVYLKNNNPKELEEYELD